MRQADSQTIEVTVTTLGGSPQTVTVSKDSKVSDVLASAGYPEESEVRCDGNVYNPTDIVDDGDRLTVLAGQKVKGGKK